MIKRFWTILVPLSILVFQNQLIGQTGEEEFPDSTISSEWDNWTLDSLDRDDFDFGANEKIRLSRGWFATPNRGSSLTFYSGLFYSDVHDRATQIRSTAFVPTTEPFDWHNPYSCGFFDYLIDGGLLGNVFEGCEERTIVARDNEPTGDYAKSDFSEFGLRFRYNLPVPAILRFDGAYRVVDGILFSEDTSRSYLSYEGIPRSFREIGVLHHRQHVLSGSAGIEIPFYGAFLETDFGSLGSYYYVYGGYGADYGVVTYSRQYSQIADAKDQIRYANNQDTVTLMLESSTRGINRLRSSVEGAVGWQVTGGFLAFGVEAFVSAPLGSMVADAEWKEYYAGLRFNIGAAWGSSGP